MRTAALVLLAAAALAAEAPARQPAADGPTVRVGFLGPDGRYTVTILPLETYVARVVAGEAARDSRPAALEALAMAVRTFALANRSRHHADGIDLCDQTHCQVVRTATAATTRAAERTAGRLLLRGAAPASIYYTASCGGRTEIPSAVWPGAEDPPFLPTQVDDACEGMPAWSAEIDVADLSRALDAAGFRGRRLENVQVVAHTASGRVARLELRGLTPPEISGQDLRVAVGRTLGWQFIKSTAFEIRRQGHAYRFTGHGSGHGVGLCVIGSARLAERGASAEAILARYFPGLAISTAALGSDQGRTEVGPRSDLSITGRGATVRGSRDVGISLPDEDAGGLRVVEAEALRARDELAKRLGLPPPPLTLRFHATTAEYERTTGLPWFTSGTVKGDAIHLSPIAALRDRGVLDQTIRREIVRLMTDAPLRGRPEWVRVGAALYFSEPAPVAPPTTRLSCPDDNELRQPVSAGALATAYARAKACFTRQIAAGRAWRDVR